MTRILWAFLSMAALLAGCASSGATELRRDDMLSYEIAQILVAHHAYDEATPILQRVLAQDPNNPRVHTMLGLVLRDRKLFSQAEQELALAYRLDPNDVDTVSGMAVMLDMAGRGDEADAWHRKALTHAPERADLYNNLGFSLFTRQRYTDAVQAYDESLRRDPGVHRVFNNLGFAYARLNNYEGALRSFQQAGSRAEALSNLGLAYQLAGEVTTARTMYEEALKLDRAQKLAQRNLEALKGASALE